MQGGENQTHGIQAGSVNDGASTSNAGLNSPTILRLPVPDTGSFSTSQPQLHTASGKTSNHMNKHVDTYGHACRPLLDCHGAINAGSSQLVNLLRKGERKRVCILQEAKSVHNLPQIKALQKL